MMLQVLDGKSNKFWMLKSAEFWMLKSAGYWMQDLSLLVSKFKILMLEGDLEVAI